MNGEPSNSARTVIITGGVSGIGKAAAERFLRDGWNVVISDINRQAGLAALEEYGRRGWAERTEFIDCDVAEESEIVRLVRMSLERFGRLDGMVNNAGTGGAFGPLVDTSVDDWDRTHQVLARGAFLGIKHAAKAMIRQDQGGAIVNVGSVAAISGGSGGAAYSAAKAAVLSLTRTAALQLAPHKIRCNAVLPGTIVTPLLTRGGDVESLTQLAAESQPWPEAGMPEHIASIIAFLAGDDSRFITGEGIVADGGNHATSPNFYGGNHPLGNELIARMVASGVTNYDSGTTATRPAASTGGPTTSAAATKHTVLITDVGSDWGRALAERLMAWGHTILGGVATQAGAAELRQSWGSPHRIDVCDVADDRQVLNWSRQLHSSGPLPDVLLNTAVHSHSPTPIWKIPQDTFSEVLQTNLVGTANVLRHFVPLMLPHPPGMIVNFRAHKPQSDGKTGASSASGWGIEGLTRVLAEEVPPKFTCVTLALGRNGETRPENSPAGNSHLEEWAAVAADFILKISRRDHGKSLTIPHAGPSV